MHEKASGLPRVARLMQKHRIQSIVRKKTGCRTPTSFMTVRWQKNASQGTLPQADLTIILDLADREVVGWALSEIMESEATTVAAWQMAVRNRPLNGSLLFHSDPGVQYACSAFREQLEDLPVLESMSRKGSCSRQCRGRELL